MERFEASSRTLWCIAAAVLGRREGADDVVQDAAVIALEKLDEFDAATNFNAWMGQIVRNVARNLGRRRQRRRTVASDSLDLMVDAASITGSSDRHSPLGGKGTLVAHQTSFDDDLVAALQSIQEIPRACLLLRAVRQMTYREIALALDIPEGTAMSHVHRARRCVAGALLPTSGAAHREGSDS